ncbi:GNAT family N-acetyltransferase [Paenarthrobacter aurescens]|jgi:ribosomal protein S18 acetylase RimI-like enzyme|uniref:Acetyltransferase, GNAT family protein n=1 Tax=Paenarthrobacter aurescens (strain TC1) TaxID=290340 RepID=A1R9I4_PAEAT|nr:GNAT family N-acetyltransferase [Paenarthrobacter aurescens]ABM07228.1 acetyltransferase, GNAT family protein [Paenarthrobacter aurescens TC1]
MDYAITAEIPTADELIELYGSVEWTAYTDDHAALVAAVDGSFCVLTARNAVGKLVGLARTVSDGYTIAYIQDILVSAEHQRLGIGGALLDELLHRTERIRQVVLLTDAEHAQRAFHESRGFTEAHDFAPHQLRSFVRFR